MTYARAIDAQDNFPIWECKRCGKQKRSTAHQRRHIFCSQECSSAANTGGTNTHVLQKKDREETAEFARLGIAAGKMFKDVAEELGMRRGRLSVICKEFGVKRPKAVLACAHCLVEFHAPVSAERKYCSYQCHLESGGAERAGEASVRAVMKYGAKKDANHKEIFTFLEAHTAVKDLSNAGFGVPDGIAWVNDGWHLFDVKNPKSGYGRRGLNPIQKNWAGDWRGGPVYLIYSVQDAENFVKARFAALKKFPDDAVKP